MNNNFDYFLLQVGKAIGASILDLTGHNPHTRIPNSEFHSLIGLHEWLRVNVLADMGISRMSARNKMPNNNNNNQVGAQENSDDTIIHTCVIC